MVGQIQLTADEAKIAAQLALDLESSHLKHEEVAANGELAASMMQSLLGRQAIPECRLRYFADPEYNISNPKASLYELFLRNCATPEAVYRHPHFLKYLRYFLYGANLPEPVKVAFASRFKESSGDREQLIQLARRQFREIARKRSPRDYLLPDAFYQLALDSGCAQWDARYIRDAVKRIKLW